MCINILLTLQVERIKYNLVDCTRASNKRSAIFGSTRGQKWISCRVIAMGIFFKGPRITYAMIRWFKSFSLWSIELQEINKSDRDNVWWTTISVFGLFCCCCCTIYGPYLIEYECQATIYSWWGGREDRSQWEVIVLCVDREMGNRDNGHLHTIAILFTI